MRAGTSSHGNGPVTASGQHGSHEALSPCRKNGGPPAPAASELSCEVCGQMPEPTKTRLTLANIAVMLLVLAAVVGTTCPTPPRSWC